MLLSKCCGINVGVRYLDVVYLERERRHSGVQTSRVIRHLNRMYIS
jgi:hypothetical protein